MYGVNRKMTDVTAGFTFIICKLHSHKNLDHAFNY